jgi:hypothetical protein
MTRKKKEELPGTGRGLGGGGRGHWRLESWKMENTAQVLNQSDPIIVEEGKEGMKKKAGVEEREEMELH